VPLALSGLVSLRPRRGLERLPVLQQRQQRLRRIGGSGVAGLVGLVQAMTRSTHTDLAWLKADPHALADHGRACGVGQLPRHRAAGRHKGGHGAIRRQRQAAGRAAGVGRVGGQRGRVMQRLGQHPPAGQRVHQPAQAAQLVGLEELDAVNVIQDAGASDRLRPGQAPPANGTAAADRRGRGVVTLRLTASAVVLVQVSLQRGDGDACLQNTDCSGAPRG